MALITWTASQFGTNVGFADEEHQILFGKLNNSRFDHSDG